MFFLYFGLQCSNVNVFPDLSNFFEEYSVIITYMNYGQNYKNNKCFNELEIFFKEHYSGLIR